MNEALERQSAELVGDDVYSSHESKFVEDTPHQTGCIPILMHVAVGNIDAPLDKERLLEMEKANKEFLEKSWANMAEDEEAEQRLLKHLEEDPQDGFQVVRKKKGNIIKKHPAVRSTYLTRKQVGPPKSFR